MKKNTDKTTDSLEQRVYDFVRQQIISKTLFPGCRIFEEQLAQDTGVSRTIVRSVLKRLNYEGLVTIVPHNGSYVAKPTAEEIRAAYECRMLLEMEAMRKACGRISREDLKRLHALVEAEYETHVNRDISTFLGINMELHHIVARNSGNLYIDKFITELNNKCNVYLLFYDNFSMTAPEASDALKEHGEIVAALESRDEERCAAAARRHNVTTLNQLKIRPF